MLYQTLKIFVRLALRIFCLNRTVEGLLNFPQTGPTLLIANHPNSFLDAILVATTLNRPVHFLARGDVFRKPWHAKWLSMLNMIPVYRLRDGPENLTRNEFAFLKSAGILSDGGVVLIFIEGICINSNQLQPFKKGAARIAAMIRQLPGFSVVPVSIAYNTFTGFGKRVNLHFSVPIQPESLFPFEEDAKNTRFFNGELYTQIEKEIAIPPAVRKISKNRRLLLFLPALIGLVVNAPLYLPVRQLVRQKTKNTVFYDSVIFGVLLITYPLYVLSVSILLIALHVQPVIALLPLLLFPLLALAAVVYRRS